MNIIFKYKTFDQIRQMHFALIKRFKNKQPLIFIYQ